MRRWIASSAAPPICFIKIDVQGYEIEVCRGMAQTIARSPDAAVVVEYSPDLAVELGYGRDDVLDFFEGCGYRAELLSQGGDIVPATRDDIIQITRVHGYTDVLFRAASRP